MINFILYWYKKGNKNLFFKYVVYPIFAALFVAGPVCFLALCKDMEAIKPWLASHLKINIVLHVWPLLSMFSLRIFKTIEEAYDKKEVVSAKQGMRLLFDCIDNVVGNKSDRFAQYAISHPQPECCVFSSITSPEDQMERLIDGIYKYFLYYAGDLEINIRVTMVEMGDTYARKFIHSIPKNIPPAGKIDEYQNDTCAFSKAKADKRMIIIEDIKKELRRRGKKKRYAKVEGDPQEGSLLVYPIRHRGLLEIVYCVSVYASEAKFFNEEERSFFEDIMDKFCRRIELEHSLKMIKDNVIRKREVENEHVA